MKTLTISEEEYFELKKKAEVTDELMIKLVSRLEDIKNSRVKKNRRIKLGLNSLFFSYIF